MARTPKRFREEYATWIAAGILLLGVGAIGLVWAMGWRWSLSAVGIMTAFYLTCVGLGRVIAWGWGWLEDRSERC